MWSHPHKEFADHFSTEFDQIIFAFLLHLYSNRSVCHKLNIIALLIPNHLIASKSCVLFGPRSIFDYFSATNSFLLFIGLYVSIERGDKFPSFFFWLESPASYPYWFCLRRQVSSYRLVGSFASFWPPLKLCSQCSMHRLSLSVT